MDINFMSVCTVLTWGQDVVSIVEYTDWKYSTVAWNAHAVLKSM